MLSPKEFWLNSAYCSKNMYHLKKKLDHALYNFGFCHLLNIYFKSQRYTCNIFLGNQFKTSKENTALKNISLQRLKLCVACCTVTWGCYARSIYIFTANPSDRCYLRNFSIGIISTSQTTHYCLPHIYLFSMWGCLRLLMGQRLKVLFVSRWKAVDIIFY